MPTPYTYANDAASTPQPSIPRLVGGTTLSLVDASKFGSPTPSAPARVVVRRSGVLRTILKATGRSGNVLTIAGTMDGYDDAQVDPGDDCRITWTRGDVEAVYEAIDAVPAGPQGPQGPAGDAGPQGPQGATGPAGPNTVAGLISQGTGIVISGAGTSGSPYLIAATGTSPGGTANQLQYNDAGAFAGAANLTFDPSTGSLGSLGNLSARGAYVEATTTQGVHLGVITSPRICFAQGGAVPNWQIDASASLFRWFTPGQVQMTITSAGLLTVRGNLYVDGTTTRIRNVPYVWPAAGGTAGQSLKTDGSGNLYWG